MRRGDYVTLPSAKNHYKLCSLEYYKQAIEYLKNRLTKFELFVFSDDILWCKENLTFEFPVNFIESGNSQSDLYLMSRCKHNVIANSSFSWWGAWLNSNKNKIVIAPNDWFIDETIDTSDLIPPSWVRI